ncbi:MAG: Diaminopimelate epimerase [Phycisphaerae bacterium]|nr:Diaminopimelate epimerase [Phycisphaerae bacterium]
MPLRFTKMHGLGNDYVYVDVFTQRVADAPSLARAVSDRHRGVGSDGLILIAPPAGDADVRMEMYNADGSRAQMCGNGIRCVAKYAYEHGLARRNPLRVETDSGVLTLQLDLDGRGHVETVRVDMGAPILDPRRIPVSCDGPRAVDVALPEAHAPLTDIRPAPREQHASRDEQPSRDQHAPRVQRPPRDETAPRDETTPRSAARDHLPPLRMTCVSMGNPHAVFFVPRLDDVPLADWGPRIEHHPLFPQRVNAHFVQVLSRTHVRMATWERGAGATQACGTGASAVCVAGVLTGHTERRISADLPGGRLTLEWDAASDHVFKTGPATEVFSGEWPD